MAIGSLFRNLKWNVYPGPFRPDPRSFAVLECPALCKFYCSTLLPAHW